MSNIYVQEPPTSGKIVLKTTMGDLDIELWANETPRTCRNFIQLCLEGYYDNLIFHRLVPGFMIQGGDPTGTGTGGESIYGKPFADEFHQRLKFTHRGIVAMANSGPSTNGSQFFITFDQTPWLDKKHTIFGKIVGDTQYNLMAMQGLEIGKNDRPINPPKILETKVLVNPFDDIALRKTKKKAEAAVQEEVKKKEPPKSKPNTSASTKKPAKNMNLLSFAEGDEEEEDEGENKTAKIVSSHDVLNDPKLLKEPVIPLEELERKRKQKELDDLKKQEFLNRVAGQGKKNKKRFSDEEDGHQSDSSGSRDENGNHGKKEIIKKGEGNAENFDEEMRRGLVKKIQLMSKNNPELNRIQIAENGENAELLGLKATKNKKTGKIEFQWEKKENSDEGSSVASSSSFSTDSEKYNEEEREVRQKQKEEYDNLKVELLQFKKNKTGTASEQVRENVRQEKKLLSALETHRMKYLENKKAKRREEDVMEKLNQFKNKINGDTTNKKDEWLKSKLKFHIDSAKAYSHYDSKEKSGNMESYMNPSKEFRERKPGELEEEAKPAKLQDVITVNDLIKMTEEN